MIHDAEMKREQFHSGFAFEITEKRGPKPSIDRQTQGKRALICLSIVYLSLLHTCSYESDYELMDNHIVIAGIAAPDMEITGIRRAMIRLESFGIRDRRSLIGPSIDHGETVSL
jgi:hypothetical protein